MEGGHERVGTGDVQRHSRRYNWKNARERKADSRLLGVVERSYDDHHPMGYLVSAKLIIVKDSLQTLSPFLTSLAPRLSPIGVFFLITAKILEMESLAQVIGQLGKYFMTVLIGLFIHGFGTIAVIFFMVVRKLPYGYVFKMSQVLATAFGTGSSSATMPITINCLDNMGIDPRVTRFVIPVGATINMDGELKGNGDGDGRKTFIEISC